MSAVFQSTLPREERQRDQIGAAIAREFQSTLPREERPTEDPELRRINDFNPRSHERSDIPQTADHSVYEISIHAPTRGATLSGSSSPWSILFQSTLPREERQIKAVEHGFSTHISIHAPTRGATLSLPSIICTVIISIHAPTRGATAILHKKFVYFYTIPTINI